MEETYSFEDALKKSLEWCAKHPGWKRMCDIEDTDSLYKTWEEMPNSIKEQWINEYGEHYAESAWKEFGSKPCKVPYGFVTGKGEFYKRVSDVPRFHNFVMVFKVG